MDRILKPLSLEFLLGRLHDLNKRVHGKYFSKYHRLLIPFKEWGARASQQPCHLLASQGTGVFTRTQQPMCSTHAWRRAGSPPP